MKKGEKKFVLSNRWLYTFISLGILLLITASVYAVETSSSLVGHSGDEITVDNTFCMRITGHNCGYDVDTDTKGETTVNNTFCMKITGHNCGYDTDTDTDTNTDYCSAGTCDGAVYSQSGAYYGFYTSGSYVGIYSKGSTYGIKSYGDYAGIYASGSSYGVHGVSTKIAVVGNGNSYDFYASGSGTNYGSSSSIRWKTNITEIPSALNKILSLRGVYYNWDEEHGGEYDMGFIAEEVGNIVPEIVEYEDETNSSNWYIDENGNKKLYATGIDYGALTPMLVEAIKEQQKIIDSQEEKINSLDEKLNKICAKLPSLCE
ncbi:tail fiber domain-containing protein [Candidatus Pacearchaeota archaeon]|jgi:hypothetical protein|nr:tail fiber domain-containing protein [Candidatus Pacearchaeota archaeon]